MIEIMGGENEPKTGEDGKGGEGEKKKEKKTFSYLTTSIRKMSQEDN